MPYSSKHYFAPLIHSKPNKKLTRMKALGLDKKSIAGNFKHYFAHTLGRHGPCFTTHYPYMALAHTVRDRLMERWKNTQRAYDDANCKRTHYLSLEFLMGRTLGNSMLNLGITDTATQGLFDLGIILEEIAESEPDAGLGNGGLGRLAACFLDSCATLQLPVKGYGIRYVYGMFRQEIQNGYQVEEPDHWLRDGNPWEVERPEFSQRVSFGGRSEFYRDHKGALRARWVDTRDVLAIPYDTPIPGFRNGTVNTLRLWQAASTDEFNLEEFNAGSYTEAVESKNNAENITMILYPNDSSENGKELRLKQQYFLASASIKDVMRKWRSLHGNNLKKFADKNCFQLNDTHPTIAVAELMRILMDEEKLDWDHAWKITSSTMAYTNHTLLPEALERWPVRLFQRLLPRLLDIIFEINAKHLAQVAIRWPGDTETQRRMSIIEEGPEPQIRMAYLAIVASMSVNGVAELHSKLLTEGLFRNFHQFWPEKFNNKTNGVTQRRWLAYCNPGLRSLLCESIGDAWISDLEQIKRIAPLAKDAQFRRHWFDIKQQNKSRHAALVEKECGVRFDTAAIFDVQVKRIHEYKRQLLNILHVIHLYERIKRGDTSNWTARCVLLGGKAAPGYVQAKLIIKLISNVARVVNEDPQVGNLLKVAFLPNYRVSTMEVICPGTDLSEQISTAGKEASGTGNMKFMMNGALTIGTLDGANIEIREEVGDENFFLFGLTEEEVKEQRLNYQPDLIIARDANLSRVMDLLEKGHFSQFEPGIFKPIISSIRSPEDPWMLAADFESYIAAQEQAAEKYRNRDKWLTSSILNSAYSGKFSTDRTMQDYNREIWKLTPIPAVPVR